MYYSIDGGYECAPVHERQIVTSWSRLPFVILLAINNNRTKIRSPASLDPLIADFVFNHSSCNRLRIGVHRCAPSSSHRPFAEAPWAPRQASVGPGLKSWCLSNFSDRCCLTQILAHEKLMARIT